MISGFQYENMNLQTFSLVPTVYICVQDPGKTKVKQNDWNSMGMLLFNYQPERNVLRCIKDMHKMYDKCNRQKILR